MTVISSVVMALASDIPTYFHMLLIDLISQHFVPFVAPSILRH